MGVTEKRRAQNKDWYEAHKEYYRKWLDARPGYKQSWYKENRHRNNCLVCGRTCPNRYCEACRNIRRVTRTPDDEMIAIWQRDKGACAACGSTHKTCWDHNHDSNEIRGLLCMACNLALGQLREDPIRVAGLARYIATHNERHATLTFRKAG